MDQLVLDEAETEFYKRHTGINDEKELKDHVSGVASKAYEIYPFFTIKSYNFMRFPILRSTAAYQRLLELGSSRQNDHFLDLGCCFGSDIRRAIEDGFPAHRIIASDLHADLWKFGLQMFNTDPLIFPVVFIPGNILDSTFIDIQPPLTEPMTDISPQALQSLIQSCERTLNPLRGHFCAIHTSNFFHLFNKEEHVLIAKKLASLLSPLPGSIIFGSHIRTSGPQPEEGPSKNQTGRSFYRHTVDSWKRMWEVEVFIDKDLVKVEVGAVQAQSSKEDSMWWIVTRL
ncbi:hypothetical protein L218DRAFT_1074108 [Marasmius fiardii PR-910]|nr:hypothetical protein L218DRAFT_1074108 [Marasmius fiardii PR-910]